MGKWVSKIWLLSFCNMYVGNIAEQKFINRRKIIICKTINVPLFLLERKMKIHWLTLDHRSWNSIIGYSILIGYSSSWTTITYTNSNSISWNWLIYFHRTKNIAQFPFLHFLPFLLTILRKCKRASFRQNIHVIFWNFCNNVCSVKKDTKHSIVLLLRLVSFFSEGTLKSGWNDIKPVSIWKNRISVLVVIA